MRLIFCLQIALLLSCQKEYEFVHTDEYLYHDCSCCEYANQIEGTYTGHYLKRLYYQPPGTSSPIMDTIYNDTISLTVTRINVPQNFISDSTICALYIDSFVNDTIYIVDGSGKFEPVIYSYQKFDLTLGRFDFEQIKTFITFSWSNYKSESFSGFK